LIRERSREAMKRGVMALMVLLVLLFIGLLGSLDPAAHFSLFLHFNIGKIKSKDKTYYYSPNANRGESRGWKGRG
jgi:hypothetical protein